MARVFGRWATLITLLFAIPLFVSENVRLYGWVLFFIKNGVLAGHAEVAVRRRAGERAVHPRHDPARHGLRLSAVHAVSR